MHRRGRLWHGDSGSAVQFGDGEMRIAWVAMVMVMAAGGVWGQGTTVPAKLKVPAGFKAAKGTEAETYTNTGWAKEIVNEKVGLEMVFIPAGEFKMGSPAGENYRSSNELQHKVKITKPFYMGKYEVTQGQVMKVMGSNPSHFTKSEKLPVEQVNWVDCQGFVAQLKRAAGNGGFALPTEAQWEYACRAGSETIYFWGPWNNGFAECVWFANTTSEKNTQEVGLKKPNAWGLYDMYGNVWEWCQDWFGENYYKESPEADPKGPATGTERVIRGASWKDGMAVHRSAKRYSYPPENKAGNSFGMRVVLELK